MATALQGQQLALYNQFKPALQVYHGDGSQNGSGVPAHCAPLVTPETQDQFIEQLSTFMATRPGITEKEPPPGVPDAQFRKDLEAQTADAVKAHKKAYIAAALGMIHNPVIGQMVQDALDQAPSKWFIAPSSSSGKYHPADEVNKSGLVLHSLRDALCADMLIDFYNQDASQNTVGNQHIGGDQRDMIVGAMLLHDIEKGGKPWKMYDAAHGPIGASFLEDVWKDNPHQEFARPMEEYVNNHMAQWNKKPSDDPRHEESDPKIPQDIPNQIVSYADYLGSQHNVFVQPFPGQDD